MQSKMAYRQKASHSKSKYVKRPHVSDSSPEIITINRNLKKKPKPSVGDIIKSDNDSDFNPEDLLNVFRSHEIVNAPTAASESSSVSSTLTSDEKLDLILTKLNVTSQDVKVNGQRISALGKNLGSDMKKLTKRISRVELESTETSRNMEILAIRNAKLESRLDRLESDSAKLALQLTGVAEEKKEKLLEKVTGILVKVEVTVSQRWFTEVYRMGPFNPDHTHSRPIYIKFHHPSDKKTVWLNRFTLEAPVHLRQHFTEIVQRTRRALQPIANYARNTDHFKDTYLTFDKLVVNGQIYQLSSLHNLPEELQIPLGGSVSDSTFYF